MSQSKLLIFGTKSKVAKDKKKNQETIQMHCFLGHVKAKTG